MKKLTQLLLLTITVLTISCSKDEKIIEKEIEVVKEVVKKDTIYIDKTKSIKDTVYVFKTDTIKVIDTLYTIDKNLPKKAKELLIKEPNFIKDYGVHVIKNTNQELKDQIVMIAYWMDSKAPLDKIKNKIIIIGYRQLIRNGVYKMQPFYYSIASHEGKFIEEKIGKDKSGFLESNNKKILPESLGKYGYIIGAYSYKNTL